MTLTFTAGVDIVVVDIPIINDFLCEPDEVFQLNLATANPDVNLDPATGFVTIQDDDGELKFPCSVQTLHCLKWVVTVVQRCVSTWTIS